VFCNIEPSLKKFDIIKVILKMLYFILMSLAVGNVVKLFFLHASKRQSRHFKPHLIFEGKASHKLVEWVASG
jgi:hypothetical protein